jgi:hypothetical protein
LYDPSTGKFSLTAPLSVQRRGCTATLLRDGRVLIAGGGSGVSVSPAEIYDPVSNKFGPTGTMIDEVDSQTATLLEDDRVLIIGGNGSRNSAELYWP